jgi:hypothetical protein
MPLGNFGREAVRGGGFGNSGVHRATATSGLATRDKKRQVLNKVLSTRDAGRA